MTAEGLEMVTEEATEKVELVEEAFAVVDARAEVVDQEAVAERATPPS
jgi:hypothetical protein